MRILLVEDDLNLSNDIRRQLVAKDNEVDVAYDGMIAEKLVQKHAYDCILADINLPGKNGYDLIKSIRTKQIEAPVILITAFGEIQDKLQGFSSGADDYITKPFFFEELMARINVVVRRSLNIRSDLHELKVEDLTIDLKKREVYRSDVSIKLTAREYEILVLLAEAQGDAVHKKDLLKKVWALPSVCSYKYKRFHIN